MWERDRSGLDSTAGIQELTVLLIPELEKNLVAVGGIPKKLGWLDLSGLPSLELFKLVTNEEALDK